MVCAEQTECFFVELLMGHMKKKKKEVKQNKPKPPHKHSLLDSTILFIVKLFETKFSPEEHILVYINRNSPGLKNKGSFLNNFSDSITLSNFSFK